MKIYTKTGDKGQTSLATGNRVAKSCERLESYGTIDELNSHLGLLIALCPDTADKAFLSTIQGQLFIIGANLSTDTQPMPQSRQISPDATEQLEAEIDRIQNQLPPLRSFILPQGTAESTQANICRTVCRRAERTIVRLTETGQPVEENLLRYINRLSDYLFILSRKLNQDKKIPDTPWR